MLSEVCSDRNDGKASVHGMYSVSWDKVVTEVWFFFFLSPKFVSFKDTLMWNSQVCTLCSGPFGK